MSLNSNWMQSLRTEMKDMIEAGEITPVEIAYKAKVSQATVYNFLSGKTKSSGKLVDWYFAHKREE